MRLGFLILSLSPTIQIRIFFNTTCVSTFISLYHTNSVFTSIRRGFLIIFLSLYHSSSAFSFIRLGFLIFSISHHTHSVVSATRLGFLIFSLYHSISVFSSLRHGFQLYISLPILIPYFLLYDVDFNLSLSTFLIPYFLQYDVVSTLLSLSLSLLHVRFSALPLCDYHNSIVSPLRNIVSYLSLSLKKLETSSISFSTAWISSLISLSTILVLSFLHIWALIVSLCVRLS